MNDKLPNKSMTPSANKMPWIGEGTVDIKLLGAVGGLGVAGDVVTVSQRVATNFVAQGKATIILKDKEKGNG